MIELISALIIAVIQGISEWIPISSSGHLVLASGILGIENSLAFDVALHFGTLMAVFVYFGRDIMNIIEDVLKWKKESENFKLGILLIVSAIPAVIVGFFLKGFFEVAFSNLGIVALGFGISALVMFIASLDLEREARDFKKMSVWSSIFIGIFQAVAIFPGVSRSGSTISAGLLTGLNERNALRFSFLMSIPVIFGANIVAVGNEVIPKEMFFATIVAFIIGLASIYALMNYVLTSKKNLRLFGLYCLLLALGLGAFVML